MARKPNEDWNFAALLVQGVARRVANELTSEKLVLPFLYTALGGSIIFAGLFAPVVIVARLVSQLLGARLVEVSSRGNILIGVAVALTAVVFIFLASGTGGVPLALLPVVFIVASALLGLSNGFSALAFQDLIGRVLGDRSRITLLFAIGAASGALVIVTTLISQVMVGFEADDQPARDHVHLVWAGVAMMLLSAGAAFMVREAPRASVANDSGEGYLASALRNARLVMRVPWFRRFVRMRVLLLSVEMVLPFFAVHAATYHAATAPSLSFFVISFSLGMIAGGLIWPRIGKRSIQMVLSLSAALAGVAALLALANHVFGGVQSLYLHAAMIFLLAFATQGSLDGSTAYVVRSSTDEQRPYAISVANLAAGVVGIGVALLAGFIADGPGVIVAIGIMGATNILGVIYALRLPDVAPDAVSDRLAGG
ncbi:MFS transporter [Bauldia litoralis]|uniref:MFS transporter n=3 Tax=Bauldia litoralis TaxID=665467 RepID=UPI003264F0A8